MVFHIVEENVRPKGAVIKAVGVGGGGGNALNHMVAKNISGVDFVCANTDMQALGNSNADTVIQLGARITGGLGAGTDPEVGREAAHEASEQLQDAVQGSDMVFITACLGGGTGTGAAPVIAEIARNMGILTIAVVTKPFGFERARRMAIADEGLDELSKYVDSLITIPNDKLMTVLGEDVTLVGAFEKANDVLCGSVQGIAELITCDGLINLDFADVKKVMSEMGMAMIGSGVAEGADRAHEATQNAINNPLLEDMDLQDVHGLLINVTASSSLKMSEYKEIGACITDIAAENAEVVIGTVIDEEMGEDLRVTMVATGFSEALSTEEAGSSAAEIKAETDQSPLPLHAKESGEVGTELPVMHSNKAELDSPAGENSENKEYEDYLDIPAFLRQQVD